MLVLFHFTDYLYFLFDKKENSPSTSKKPAAKKNSRNKLVKNRRAPPKKKKNTGWIYLPEGVTPQMYFWQKQFGSSFTADSDRKKAPHSSAESGMEKKSASAVSEKTKKDNDVSLILLIFIQIKTNRRNFVCSQLLGILTILKKMNSIFWETKKVLLVDTCITRI